MIFYDLILENYFMLVGNVVEEWKMLVSFGIKIIRYLKYI